MLKVLSDTSIRPTLAENGRPFERVASIKLQPVAVILKPFFQTAFMPEIFRRRLRPSESLKFSVGRILESDILGIAAMDCNDGSIKDFVGYKYPTYACCVAQPRTRLVEMQATACLSKERVRAYRTHPTRWF